MFRKLIKNKKAQQTAEYALLISLVVAAVIAMQTYAQRTIQGRIRDAGGYLSSQTSALGDTNQYEPYYLESSYDVYRDDSVVQTQTFDSATNRAIFRTTDDSARNRASGGYQQSSYNGWGLEWQP